MSGRLSFITNSVVVFFFFSLFGRTAWETCNGVTCVARPPNLLWSTLLFNSTMCFVSLVCLVRIVRLVCLVRLISLVSLRAGIGGKTTKASNAANGTRKQTMGKFLLLPYPATGLRSWLACCRSQMTALVGARFILQHHSTSYHSTTAPHTTASQHLIPQHLITQHHSTTAPHTAAPQHLIPQHSTPTWLSLRRRGGMRKAAAVAVVAAVAVAAGAGVGVGVGAGAGAGAGVGVGAVAHLHENRHGDTIAVQLHRAWDSPETLTKVQVGSTKHGTVCSEEDQDVVHKLCKFRQMSDTVWHLTESHVPACLSYICPVPNP